MRKNPDDRFSSAEILKKEIKACRAQILKAEKKSTKKIILSDFTKHNQLQKKHKQRFQKKQQKYKVLTIFTIILLPCIAFLLIKMAIYLQCTKECRHPN